MVFTQCASAEQVFYYRLEHIVTRRLLNNVYTMFCKDGVIGLLWRRGEHDYGNPFELAVSFYLQHGIFTIKYGHIDIHYNKTGQRLV